ncbi:MAG: class E sortase, partial [Solirubrobacterales bacterium]|nr:class E sortase [Solirubrobacterales bacterium]
AELAVARGSMAPPADAPAGEAAAAAPPRISAGRRAWRGVLVAGLVGGVLLVADGVLTIAWQEPVTAFLQDRAQTGLGDDLQALEDEFAAAPAVARETERRRMRRQASALLRNRDPGEALGRLEIPRMGLRSVVVQSTQAGALRKGPGHYAGTVLPGMAGTVGIAGHRTTYGAPFRDIDDLRRGSEIRLRMPYGTFTYKVASTRITTPDDASSLRSRAGSDRLVLTACHPLYSAAKRIVVTATLQRSAPPGAATPS